MSGEGNNAVAGSSSSGSTATDTKDNRSQQNADSRNTEENIGDDSDFVQVVSRKKKQTTESQNSKIHYHHHKPNRHQSHYNDGGGGDDDDYGRRRRFRDHHNNNHLKRDNSTGSKQSRGRMNKRDNFRQNNQQPASPNDKENTAVLPVCTEQINKTGSSLPAPAVSPTAPTQPVVKSFSLVVSAGCSGASSNTSNKSSSQQRLPPPDSWVPILHQQQPKSTMCPLPTRPLATSVNHNNVVDKTNSQLPDVKEEPKTPTAGAVDGAVLADVNERASASSSSVVTERSSSISILETSSLTSEETIDSSSGSVTKSSDQVEYVEAPIPKVNPWLANRNAAQVIVSSTAAPTSKNKIPAVDQSFPEKPLNSRKSQTSTSNCPQEVSQPTPFPKQTNLKKPTATQIIDAQKANNSNPPSQGSQSNDIANASIPSQSKPASFAQAITSSPATKVTQAQPTEAKSSALDNSLSSSVEAPNLLKSYVREPSIGFRPGRGRGSYSASAAAGRKIPSRSQVLKKVVDSEDMGMQAQSTCDEWPTLGETIIATVSQQQPKLKVDEIETATELTDVEEKNKPCVAITEDVVDSNSNHHKTSAVAAGNGNPELAAIPANSPNIKAPLSPGMSSHSSNEDHCSDNDYDDSHKNANGTPGKKANKQKWRPLDFEPSTGTGEPEWRSHGGGSRYGGGTKGGRGKQYGYYPSSGHGHHQNSQYNSGQNHYQHHHGGNSGGGGGGRGVGGRSMWKNSMNGHYEDLEMDHRNSRYPTQSSRGMRGGPRNGSRSHSHNNGYYSRKQNGGPPSRNGSTPSLNSNSSLMNGHSHHYHPPALHAPATLEILSPTNSTVGSIYDFSPVPSTLTPMYPAHTEFIMPYVSNGYFPTPYLAPTTGVILTDTGSTNEETQEQSMEQFELLTDKVRTQIEYYFSEGNLDKDFYLRRKMDEEGYLSIYLLATFPRVRNMTQDYSVIMEAIKSSDKLELKQDESGVRTAIDPFKWPLAEPHSAIIGTVHHDNNTIVPSSSIDSYSSDCSSSASSSSSQSQSINNNDNQTLLLSSATSEMLNPNVPEFVPKSKVM